MLMSTEHHEALQVQLKTNLQNGVAEHDHAMRIARSEHRAHSLLETRRFWQLVAVVPGAVEAWGYAYEGGTFGSNGLPGKGQGMAPTPHQQNNHVHKIFEGMHPFEVSA